MDVWTLKTCDTCKKALAWLDENGIAYEAKEIRGADGTAAIDREIIQRIVAAVGPERAVNRRSTTWRELPDAAKKNLDASSAIALIESHPTLLKRPAFLPDGEDAQVMVGFDAGVRNALR